MKIDVLNKQGQPTGRQVDLDDSVFGAEVNDHAIYLAVRQYQANQRQGTHKSKERGEIAGSRKKLKKQKGTGTARFGDIKNPIFRGGGRVFGPRPRNYGFKLNKKVKRLARNSALTYKAKESSIKVIEDLQFDAPKTKDFVSLLKNLGIEGKRTLVVSNDGNKNLVLSARNVPITEVSDAGSLNTFDIIKANALVLSESAIASIS